MNADMQRQSASATVGGSGRRYAYTRKCLLGKGNFAQVFLGEPCPPPPPGSSLPRYVAVKQIDQSKLANNSRMCRQMRNEITLLRDLSGHANIVRLLDCYEDHANHYVLLVLEYCDGGDLSAYLRKHAPLAPDVVQDMVQQVASAVRHMRKRNVVHRDLKPQNILLSRDMSCLCGWCLKVADFGLACRLTDQDMTATYCGSPLHMAPELVAGGRYAPGVDLWSIGTIVYQMVTGVLPFRANTLAELRHKLQDEARRGASVPLPDTCPAPLADLVRGLLQTDPAQRLSYEAFYCHPFLRGASGGRGGGGAVTLPPPGRGLGPTITHVAAPGNNTLAARGGTAPAAAMARTVVEVDADSYCLIDRHMEEFRFLLDQLQAAGNDVLQDDPRQQALRRLADAGVRDAEAVFSVAEGLRPAEALLLYARALALLRHVVDQARPYMDVVRGARPCRQTLASALRFRRCMEHCLAQAGELRRRALHEDALCVAGAREGDDHDDDGSGGNYLTPQQAMMNAALDLTRRAQLRDVQARCQGQAGLRPLALALYDRALRLLRLLEQAPGGTVVDQEHLSALLRRTEQRRSALDPHSVTPMAPSLLQQQLAAASQIVGSGSGSGGGGGGAPAGDGAPSLVTTLSVSSPAPAKACSSFTPPLAAGGTLLCSDGIHGEPQPFRPPLASAPIAVPAVRRARQTSTLHDSTTCRARFCGQCGLHYKCQDDNFCSMCGTERREVAGASLSASLGVTPTSLTRSLPPLAREAVTAAVPHSLK